MRGVEIGRLAGVHHRPASDRNIAIDAGGGRKRRGLGKGRIGRLDPDLVEHRDVDPGVRERPGHGGERFAAADALVGEERHALQPQFACLRAGFGQHPGTEGKRGHADGETAIAAFQQREVGVATGHLRSF
jgi:hypothetical protein